MMKRQIIFLTISLLIVFTASASALDNGYQIGTPFTINTNANNNTVIKAASTNGDTFLVTYLVDYTTLYAQLIGSNGSLIGAPFTLAGVGGDISIASDGNNYLVAFTYNDNLYVLRMDNSGTIITPISSISSSTTEEYENPHVTFNGTQYLIVWQKQWTEEGNYINAVFGRILDINASPVGQEFQINQNIIDDNYLLPIKAASNGNNFFVVWTSTRPGTKHVVGRLLDASGQPLTDELQLNTLNEAISEAPRIVYNGDLYLIFWVYQEIMTSPTAFPVMMRQYDAQANPLREEVKVARVRNVWSSPSYSISPGTFQGNFLCFHGYNFDISYNTYAQFIDSNGFSCGSEFSLKTDVYSYSDIVKNGETYLYLYIIPSTHFFGVIISPLSNNITITQQPQDATTYTNEDAIFSVSANSSAGAVSYQWYKNHEPIDTTSTILFQNAQLTDTHTFFYCDIQDTAGGFVRTNAGVMTVLPPLFTVSIQGPSYVFGGRNAAFTATADFGDDNIFDVTEFVEWIISPTDLGTINLDGLLATNFVTEFETGLIKATLTTDGETHWAYCTINIDLPFQVTAMTPAPESTESAAPLEIVITLSDTLNPASVITENCLFIKPGSDGLFGTADDSTLPCVPSLTGAQEITLDISELLLPNGDYQIKLTGITNQNLTPLDGEFSGSFPSGNNVPGGDFTATFSIERLITSGIIFNDNDTVTLTWDEFRDGTVYVVEYTDDLVTWAPVPPIEQWPISETTWTGGSWMGFDDRFFKVVGIVPSIYSVSPNYGYLGDFSHDVTIIGFGAQLDDPNLTVSFGDGITVHSVTVLGASQIIVNIRISLLADVGFRDITITTSEKIYIKEDAFEVLAE